MKIIIRNKTHWRTDQLRDFVREAIQRERPGISKAGCDAFRVDVVYNRGGNRYQWCSGSAHLNSYAMRIKIPSGNVDRIDLAHVLVHELGHTAGLTHSDMGCPVYSRVGNWREIYAWGETLPLEKQNKIKVRSTRDAKLIHAEKMLHLAETREKRAVTIRKKWQRKVKYYQRDIETLPLAAENVLAQRNS